MIKGSTITGKSAYAIGTELGDLQENHEEIHDVASLPSRAKSITRKAPC